MAVSRLPKDRQPAWLMHVVGHEKAQKKPKKLTNSVPVMRRLTPTLSCPRLAVANYETCRGQLEQQLGHLAHKEF